MSSLQMLEARAKELGCTVIAVDLQAQIVLCSKAPTQHMVEHITWAFSTESGDAADFFWGHYLTDAESGRQDYQERVETCLTNLNCTPRDLWGEESI